MEEALLPCILGHNSAMCCLLDSEMYLLLGFLAVYWCGASRELENRSTHI